MESSRPADGQAVDAQGRLADADRHVLSVLAAHANAWIEFQVMPIIITWLIASGPLPIRVAPLMG